MDSTPKFKVGEKVIGRSVLCYDRIGYERILNKEVTITGFYEEVSGEGADSSVKDSWVYEYECMWGYSDTEPVLQEGAALESFFSKVKENCI